MRKFKIQLHNQALTEKGIEALTDFYRLMSIDTLRLPGLNAFIMGIDSPFLNVVIDTRENSRTLQDITIIENFFNVHRVPWSWFVTSIAKNNNLKQLGFSLLEEMPSMYFNLANALQKISTNFISIQEVDQNDDLSKWSQAIQEGFPSDDQGEGYRKLNANLLQKGEKRLRHFIAYNKNQIAASATLFLSADSVMLHNLATKITFRKQGIGTALTYHMMQEAQKIGYKHCFLDSSEEGFNLYQKLGFQVYCSTLIYGRR